MKKACRGRPMVEDRSKIKQRINVSMLDEVRQMAAVCGEGNVSLGVEAAVRDYYERLKVRQG